MMMMVTIIIITTTTAEKDDFFPLASVSGSALRPHLASYPMGTGGFFPGGKALLEHDLISI
jgi:hypothetical protein